MSPKLYEHSIGIKKRKKKKKKKSILVNVINIWYISMLNEVCEQRNIGVAEAETNIKDDWFKGMEPVSSESQKSTLDSKHELAKSEAKAQVVLDDSSETELTKIRLMRSFVESQDPSSKDVDDLMIRRFLRARDLDVDKASAMFLKYLKWRHSFVPNGSISPSEIPDELAHGKMFVQGHDKKGRPITVAFAAKHFQNKDGDAFKRYVVFALEKLCSRMPPGQEKFLAIADIKGWGYANSDLRGYLNALAILQDYYPERLGKLFIVHAPSLFMKVWKIVNTFIDSNTKKKILFVENKKLKSTLLEDIDESQIPEIYGGKMPLVPIQDS